MSYDPTPTMPGPNPTVRPWRIGLRCLNLVVFSWMVVACQPEPLARQEAPSPGLKAAETLPPVPDGEPQRHTDGSVPIPLATTPAITGDQNSPGAPVPLPAAPAPAHAVPAASADADSHAEAIVKVSPTVPPVTRPAPPSSAPPANTQRDLEITTAVQRAVTEVIGTVAATRTVVVSTTAGEVTLTGAVTSAEHRDQLVTRAGLVAGVRSVNNQLTLNHP